MHAAKNVARLSRRTGTGTATHVLSWPRRIMSPPVYLAQLSLSASILLFLTNAFQCLPRPLHTLRVPAPRPACACACTSGRFLCAAVIAFSSAQLRNHCRTPSHHEPLHTKAVADRPGRVVAGGPRHSRCVLRPAAVVYGAAAPSSRAPPARHLSSGGCSLRCSARAGSSLHGPVERGAGAAQ